MSVVVASGVFALGLPWFLAILLTPSLPGAFVEIQFDVPDGSASGLMS